MKSINSPLNPQKLNFLRGGQQQPRFPSFFERCMPDGMPESPLLNLFGKRNLGDSCQPSGSLASFAFAFSWQFLHVLPNFYLVFWVVSPFFTPLATCQPTFSRSEKSGLWRPRDLKPVPPVGFVRDGGSEWPFLGLKRPARSWAPARIFFHGE